MSENKQREYPEEKISFRSKVDRIIGLGRQRLRRILGYQEIPKEIINSEIPPVEVVIERTPATIFESISGKIKDSLKEGIYTEIHELSDGIIYIVPSLMRHLYSSPSVATLTGTHSMFDGIRSERLLQNPVLDDETSYLMELGLDTYKTMRAKGVMLLVNGEYRLRIDREVNYEERSLDYSRRKASTIQELNISPIDILIIREKREGEVDLEMSIQMLTDKLIVGQYNNNTLSYRSDINESPQAGFLLDGKLLDLGERFQLNGTIGNVPARRHAEALHVIAERNPLIDPNIFPAIRVRLPDTGRELRQSSIALVTARHLLDPENRILNLELFINGENIPIAVPLTSLRKLQGFFFKGYINAFGLEYGFWQKMVLSQIIDVIDLKTIVNSTPPDKDPASMTVYSSYIKSKDLLIMTYSVGTRTNWEQIRPEILTEELITQEITRPFTKH